MNLRISRKYRDSNKVFHDRFKQHIDDFIFKYFNKVVEYISYVFVVIISCFKSYTKTLSKNTIFAQYTYDRHYRTYCEKEHNLPKIINQL